MRYLFSLLLLLTLSFTATASDVPDPFTSVQKTTDRLLAKLVEVQPLYEKDPKAFYKEIRTSLEPFIDFDGFARGVMAKYYRLATEEQKQKFAETFQTELIQTYSKALVEFDNQKIEVLPLEEPPKDGRATVQVNVYGKDGTVYPVVYSLVLVEGEWKLRNIVINGINIGLQFRSQFQNYMQKYRNNIDDVIANWNVDV
ncbi:MAG: ABC transporter substrate-binding protein [Pseudomonadales bacterium]|nr:ABC transporter substrate-binding protein [Pseudomonadales bacterium]